MRTLLNLPFRAHTWCLGPLIGRIHLRGQLHVREWKFLKGLLRCRNNLVRSVVLNAYHDARGPIGQNIAYLRHLYGISVTDDFRSGLNAIRSCFSLNVDNEHVVETVKELLSCKDGLLEVNLSKEEISTVISSLVC